MVWLCVEEMGWSCLDESIGFGGQRKKERQKRTWKKQVEEVSVKIGLKKEDALNRSQWSVGVDQFCCWVEVIWSPSFVLDTTRF